MVEIRRYTTNDKQRWDEFVALSKNATFLHYRDYMDYHSDRFSDHSLMAFNEKGKLIALLPANADGDTLYSHQGLTFGGWLTQVKHFNANNMLEIFDSMCDYLKTNGFRTLIYKAIPHIYHKYPAEEDLYALFRHKATIETCNLSTTAIPTSTYNKYGNSTKLNIKKAVLSGMTIEESQNFSEFWQLLDKHLMLRHNATPVHSLEEIELLHSHFPQNIRLFEVRFEKELIAGCVFYITDNVAHSQYTASSEIGMKMNAVAFLHNHLLHNVFVNFPYYDFGISNENNGRFLNTGLISQKEGLGGRGIAYNIYKIQL